MISRNTEEFQWDNLEFFCFSPTSTSITSGKEIRKPRIANSLYLGYFPKEHEFSFGINGIQFEGKKVNCIFKARRHSIQVKNEPVCLIMELEKDTIQFIELDDILDAKSLKTLDNWVTSENKILLKIANEYEQFNRQFYHFMYDVISLSKEISELEESEQDKLLHETNTALILLHNRIQAEVSSAYRSNGKNVTLFPEKISDNHKPDLMVSDTYVDIKRLLFLEGIRTNF